MYGVSVECDMQWDNSDLQKWIQFDDEQWSSDVYSANDDDMYVEPV
jgi:hypothetical protein